MLSNCWKKLEVSVVTTFVGQLGRKLLLSVAVVSPLQMCLAVITRSFHCHNVANSPFLDQITGLLTNGVAGASPCLLGPL